MKNQKKSLGLTLLELLITIAIVGVISAIGYATYDNGQKKARDSKRKNDLKDVQNALQLYYQDFGYYPDSNTGSNYSAESSCSSTWISGLAVSYIKQVPCDPKNSGTLIYRYDSPDPANVVSAHGSYRLSADLENNSDPQRSSGCNSNKSVHDYCVPNP